MTARRPSARIDAVRRQVARGEVARAEAARARAQRTPANASSTTRSDAGRVVAASEVRSLRTLEYVLGTDPAVVRGFARAAADSLNDGPLTLDVRDRLLKRGERLGLRRFDANLVLAAVEQHRRRASPLPAASVIPAGVASHALVWPAAAVAVAVQAMIATGAWWLLA
ncbi:MAG TPA: hypothetical protein VF595_15355 [Tepidisphaeraceae bacterium]|jgi:hypothetical protein